MVTETPRAKNEAVRRVALWRLEHEVDYTREAIIKRARSLADRLTQLADRLEDNPDYTFNTLASCRATEWSWTAGA